MACDCHINPFPNKSSKSPIFQGERLPLVEAHSDMAIVEVINYRRTNPAYDGGITRVTKIGHAAEGFCMNV